MSRLKEPSTWASLAGMWLASAQYIQVEVLPKWCAVGMAVASAIAGVVLRESGGSTIAKDEVQIVKAPSVTVVNANVQARGEVDYGNDRNRT